MTPKCEDCKWRCMHQLELFKHAESARSKHGTCGPDGKLFEKKEGK